MWTPGTSPPGASVRTCDLAKVDSRPRDVKTAGAESRTGWVSGGCSGDRLRVESATVKLNGKNLPVLIRLLLLSMVVATIAWELIERLIALGGGSLDLSLGPVGFDIGVIALWIQANPGTLIGIVPAIILFRRA